MPADFSSYLKQFDSDLHRLTDVMHSQLGSEIAVVKEMQKETYFTGGKQLRALVTMFSTRLCGVTQHTGDEVAVAIEFIHTATLLHDDVVDDAPMRRHLPAAAKTYGSAVAVLAGDFLYSRASQILARQNNLPLLQRVAYVTNKLAEGELLQLMNRGKPDIDEATYYKIIEYKTANLFSIAAATGAVLQGDDDTALHQYGKNIGIAFQLVDDCLDYEGEGEILGKKIGADFNEGKMTLPVIYMLARSDKATRERLIQQWQNGEDTFAQTTALLHTTGALVAVRALATQHTAAAAAALAHYPDSAEKAALITLAELSAKRNK